MQDKIRFREKMARVLGNLPPAERSGKSRQIVNRICSGTWWEEAAAVCAYLSFGGEVETGELVSRVRGTGKTLGLPRITGRDIFFHDATGKTRRYTRHGYGMNEPAADTPRLKFESLACPVLMVIPGIAFDRQGNRLGRGGGFYDRFLNRWREESHITRLGICFSEQLVPRVPVGPYDAPMDLVITEKEILSFQT